MTLEYVADKKKLIFLCQKHACQEGTQNTEKKAKYKRKIHKKKHTKFI